MGTTRNEISRIRKVSSGWSSAPTCPSAGRSTNWAFRRRRSIAGDLYRAFGVARSGNRIPNDVRGGSSIWLVRELAVKFTDQGLLLPGCWRQGLDQLRRDQGGQRVRTRRRHRLETDFTTSRSSAGAGSICRRSSTTTPATSSPCTTMKAADVWPKGVDPDATRPQATSAQRQWADISADLADWLVIRAFGAQTIRRPRKDRTLASDAEEPCCWLCGDLRRSGLHRAL